MKLMFCMFGEDIGLLPERLFTKLLENAKANPAVLTRRLESLFAAMAKGGDFGPDEIKWFNGGLFDDTDVLPLKKEEINILAAVNQYDWSNVEPAIFGTLFERTLDPDKRSQIGTHYTSKEDILTLLEPVLMAPLRREWAEVKNRCEGKLWPKLEKASRQAAGKKAGVSAKASKERKAFDRAIKDFTERLHAVTVLDPACGSGNFLYVSINLLLDLEKEVVAYAAAHGLSLIPHVRPTQLLGLEINAYAQQLAQVVIWIGYLQWMHHNGFKMPSDPVLEPIESIRCQDSILDLSDTENPKEPEWPNADFIVGNPPFLGGSKIWEKLGRDYQEHLWKLYEDRLPGSSDLCCYWFERARKQIEQGKASRAALLATQAIRGGANREVIKRIKSTGDIFFAFSDRDWILDGANVHISMIGFDDGKEKERYLDGKKVSIIHPNLTAYTDVTTARPLRENTDISFRGTQKSGDFDICDELAREWLLSPNPHGQPNSNVIRPWLNGSAIVKRMPPVWIIDTGIDLKLEEFALYETPHNHALKYVKPQRDKNKRDHRRMNWWLHAETCPGMRAAMKVHLRFLTTPRISKFRIFSWSDSVVLPDDGIYVFARSDDYFFGILHSRVHEVWALKLGTRLETRPRYTPTTCFETFPLPEATDKQTKAIGEAAKELDELRKRWLNPPEWTKTEVLEFPGSVEGPWARYIDPTTVPQIQGANGPHPRPLSQKGEGRIGTVRWPRMIPKDADCAVSLKKRTLTNLYNQRPQWLQNVHEKLDAAVFAAYGWSPGISDEELLERLLELNLQRAEKEKSGY